MGYYATAPTPDYTPVFAPNLLKLRAWPSSIRLNSRRSGFWHRARDNDREKGGP
jgi:hypothetical protein